MLSALSIRNVVLIEKLDLDFQKGLCVFTGETGAGKSILLDSLSLVLGARADSSLVRHGCDSLSVVASFCVSLAHPVHKVLLEHGLKTEAEDDIILKRTVSKEGKSKAFINDQPVSATMLKSIGDALVEIHGQFASHHLLNPAVHLEVLDGYGHLTDVVANCRRAYRMWQYKKSLRDDAEQRLMQAKQEETFLRDSIADLRSLNPVEGEEEELIQKRTVLMNGEKIVAALNTVYQLLSDEGQGAMHHIEQALWQLDKANALSDNEFNDIFVSTEQAESALADAVANLERSMQNWSDISQLPQIDDRLFALKDVARKHHVSVSELTELLADFEQKLSALENGHDEIASLQKEEENARLTYIECAQKLSAERIKAAKKLDKAVSEELPALKLSKASFLTQIQEIPSHEWNEHGMDKVVFMVSTNTGTPFAPIHKVASGGELSRFMLALKVNLASSEQLDTLIFDEVDTGIGGATAAAVGQRLAKLSNDCQVLVVTHSPQVAAFGAHHYVVGKSEQKGAVVTQVRFISDDERLMEVARMLSGAEITESGKQMAQELLDKSCKKI
ncbi:MAG: DNA repair protein RecN [Alphaproteobacteria bacterium]|nr:DNA repair protein RecN [Alphaproteobacteria bacterium]